MQNADDPWLFRTAAFRLGELSACAAVRQGLEHTTTKSNASAHRVDMATADFQPDGLAGLSNQLCAQACEHRLDRFDSAYLKQPGLAAWHDASTHCGSAVAW